MYDWQPVFLEWLIIIIMLSIIGQLCLGGPGYTSRTVTYLYM